MRPEQGMPDLYHTAFEVDSAAELLHAFEVLQSLEIQFSPIDHGISLALYAEDPDGNGIEIYLDKRNLEDGTKVWSGKSKRFSKLDLESFR